MEGDSVDADREGLVNDLESALGEFLLDEFLRALLTPWENLADVGAPSVQMAFAVFLLTDRTDSALSSLRASVVRAQIRLQELTPSFKSDGMR